MKKLSLMMISACLMFSLVACGEVVETETNTNAETTSEESSNDAEVVLDATPVTTDSSAEAVTVGIPEADVVVKAGTVDIKLGDDFLPNVDAVGSANIVEGQACLDGGYDTNYYYNDEALVVYTIASNGQQVIYDIYVTDSSYTIANGVAIGITTKDDIVAMYGEATSSAGAALIYAIAGTEDSKVTFAFDADGVLESIDVLDEQ